MRPNLRYILGCQNKDLLVTGYERSRGRLSLLDAFYSIISRMQTLPSLAV